MAEEDRLVEQLQNELRHEAFSRQFQEELNSKLQDEYDELLKRLAEAELHIDRMRLGANVDFNKYFIIRHHREQNNTLYQRLEAQFDPEWRKPLQDQPGNDAAAVRSTGVGTEGSPGTHQNTASFSSDLINRKQTWENNSSSDVHQIEGSSSSVQNVKDSNNVAANHYVPLSPHIAGSNGSSSRELTNGSSLQSTPNDHSSRSLDTSASLSALDSSSSAHFNAHHTSNGFRGLKGHQRGRSNSQEMLLQSSNLSPSLTHSQLSFSHPSSFHQNSVQHHASSSSTSSHPSSSSCAHLSSSHGHTPSSYASTDDVSLSKMSASTIEVRGSTESLQLAHLFKVHSLQEELEHLKLKLNDRSVPLDEIVQDASRIHWEHRQLAGDVETLSTNLDTLRNKNDGKVPDRIARSKRAIENELASLAEQLQEVYDLLRARAEEEKKSNLPLPEAPSLPIQKKDSDSQLSSAFYDSLNSPYLPTKYLNHEATTNNQLQSPQGSPPSLSNGRKSLSPGALHPSLSSIPLESNSSTHLTNDAVDSQQLLSNYILHTGKRSSHSRDDNIIGGSGENMPDDSDSSTQLEQLIELGVSGHRIGGKNEGEAPTTLSDLSDEEEELNVHIHLPKDSPNGSGRSPSPLDLSRCMTPTPSPDSLHLQEAKRNLKQAEELGYRRSNSHPESLGSRDDHSSQSNNKIAVQSSGDLSHTLNPAATNRRRNTLTLPPSRSSKPSQIPRLIQSQLSPRPCYRGPNSSGYPHSHHRQTQQNSSNTTAAGASMSKEDQSGLAYPGEGDSGFAGSEFPSRTATRMDTTTNPTRSLTSSSVLQSTTSEDDANQQRFLEASAAIEALRKELADLKLQMMINVVKHSDSIPRTPSSRSHSTIKGPPSPTITMSRLNSGEYSPSSSQPKLLTREFSSNPSALSLPLHRINTPSHHALTDGGRSSQMNTNAASSHYTLTDGGRSSQMTTTSLTTSNAASSHDTLTDGGRSSRMTTISSTTRSTNMNTPSSHHTLTDGGQSSQLTTTGSTTTNINTPSSHHTLTDGGRSSQMTTTTSLIANNIDTNTPSHSSESTTSPTHTWGSSATVVTKVGLTPKGSLGSGSSNGGQPSSICLSTPALSSYASLKSTPIPTPQHSVTGHTTSGASFRRPNSIASGRYNVVPSGPSNGYASSSNASDQLTSRVPGCDSASDHYKNDHMGYYHSSQPTSIATTAPSMIRRTITKAGANHYRPPSYEQARMIPSHSNRATANSSFIVPSAISAPPLEPNDTEKGCATVTEDVPSVAGVSDNNACCNCFENGTRSSHGATTQRQAYAPSYDTHPSHKQRHRSTESSGAANVGTANSLVQSDREMGHGPYANPSHEQIHSHHSTESGGAANVGTANSVVLSDREVRRGPYSNPSHEQIHSHRSTESRGAAKVDSANSLVQSDREMGHGPCYHVKSVDASNVMSFNGAQQTPMATSTPSRRDAVLNTRHIHAQKPYYARDKLSERFKDSRESSEGENIAAGGAGMPASYNTPAGRSRPVASNRNTLPRYYSSTSASRSPENQRKNSEEFTTYSTRSSPARSQAQYHGYSSGVSSSAQSSPGHGYSSTRRASSPALYYTSARRKSYGERIVKEHGRARHSDNNIGGYQEDSSGNSGEERHRDRQAYLSPEGHDGTCVAHDNTTPHVHVHVPTSARHVSIRRHKPSSHYRDNHYSDSETSPEHQYHAHTKPRVVKVVNTPKLRKRQVVYVAPENTPPEEIYYSETGSGLFTPRQTSHGRRVVGVVESRSGRSLSRGDRGVRVARLRESRPRKVYMEQPSEPVKRVYIVEPESESESDLERIETIEMHEINLDDTLQLAHALKRRSKRLHGTLQAELERQAFH